jgi:hypothetical protein
VSKPSAWGTSESLILSEDEALARLGSALRQRSTVAVPLPMSVLFEEIDAWVKHQRVGPWKRNNTQLMREVNRSLDALGPRLRNAASGYLNEFSSAMIAVTDEQNPSQNQRHAALAATQVARVAVITPSALLAAWEDVVSASADHASRFDAIMAAVTALRAGLAAAGHDAAKMLVRLSELLDDDAVAVVETRLKLGLESEPPGDWRGLHGTQAGTSMSERKALCQDLVSSPAPSGRCIAWLSYKQAEVVTGIEAGPCTFYNAHWALGNVENEDGQEFLGRGELKDDFAHPGPVGPDEKVVLARVDLGTRSPIGALETAERLVGALVDTASHRSDGARWLPYGWNMLVLDGRRISSTSYATEDDMATWERPHERLRTSTELAELGPRLGTALAHSLLPSDLAEALRTAGESRSADTRSRIVLDDRVVEFVAASAGVENGHTIADLIVSGWPEARWRTELTNIILGALDAIRWRPDTAAAKLAGQVRTSDRHGSFTIHFDIAADCAEDLVGLLEDPMDVLHARELFATLNNGSSFLAYTGARRAEAAILTERLRRVRNALAHGNPTQSDSIESVAAFSTYIANSTLHEALDAYRDGHVMLHRLREYEARRVSENAAYSSGASPRSRWRK